MQSDNGKRRTVRRRRFIQLAGAGTGLATLAGCLGDDDDDPDPGDDVDPGDDDPDPDDTDPDPADELPDRLTVLTTPPGTAGEAMGAAMMSVISRDTPMEGSSIVGGGSIQNIVEIMRGDAHLSRGVTSVLYAALNREDPVEIDAPYDPLQLISHQFLRLILVCRSEDDYEYISDLEGQPIGQGPVDASFQPVLNRAYETIIPDHNPIYQAPTEMAPSLAAGDIEAVITMNANGAPPAFAQDINARGVRVLGVREENQELLRNDPDVPTVMQPNDFWEGTIDDYTMEGESFCPEVRYSMISNAVTNEETVYTFLDTLYQAREELPDIFAGFGPWTETEWYTQLVDPRIPFHPGAERFLREIDLWDDDEFEVADI